jgi:hypothetical protein
VTLLIIAKTAEVTVARATAFMVLEKRYDGLSVFLKKTTERVREGKRMNRTEVKNTGESVDALRIVLYAALVAWVFFVLVFSAPNLELLLKIYAATMVFAGLAYIALFDNQ